MNKLEQIRKSVKDFSAKGEDAYWAHEVSADIWVKHCRYLLKQIDKLEKK